MINKKELERIITNEGLRIGVCVIEQNGKIFFEKDSLSMYDTACSIMVFIMLEYYKQLGSGKFLEDVLIEYTKDNYATGSGSIKYLSFGSKVRIKDLVLLMVAASDHIAANMLIDFLGLDEINKTIQEEGFINTRIHKKFLIPQVKNIATSTPFDLALFYNKLMNNSFFNSVDCKAMIDVLLQQKYKDLLTDTFDKNDGIYIDCASKSGLADGKIYNQSTNSYIVDGGIIYNKKRNYCISLMCDLYHDSKITISEVRTIMHKISKTIYREVIKS